MVTPIHSDVLLHGDLYAFATKMSICIKV